MDNKEDNSLDLLDNEPEILVIMTGQLQLNNESEEEHAISYWTLKLDSKSFETALNTPVRCSFQTHDTLCNVLNSQELELTGNYDKAWLNEHLGQTVTLSGYLWHAHTAHHHRPILMDTDPWFNMD